MMMRPNLSLVITQGTQRVALIAGDVIYQAAILFLHPYAAQSTVPAVHPAAGPDVQGGPWGRGRTWQVRYLLKGLSRKANRDESHSLEGAKELSPEHIEQVWERGTRKFCWG